MRIPRLRGNRQIKRSLFTPNPAWGLKGQAGRRKSTGECLSQYNWRRTVSLGRLYPPSSPSSASVSMRVSDFNHFIIWETPNLSVFVSLDKINRVFPPTWGSRRETARVLRNGGGRQSYTYKTQWQRQEGPDREFVAHSSLSHQNHDWNNKGESDADRP